MQLIFYNCPVYVMLNLHNLFASFYFLQYRVKYKLLKTFVTHLFIVSKYTFTQV